MAVANLVTTTVYLSILSTNKSLLLITAKEELNGITTLSHKYT
jgi:hypothetical protein